MGKQIWAKKPEGKEFEMVEPGNYMARCYSMIALGTQIEVFDGLEKKQEKVRITWEIPTESMKDGRPFVIGKKYTLSMHEKSNLIKDLQSWRGRKFTEQEAEKFDITTIIDAPCMLNVIQAEGKNGRTYTNIASISPLPKGMTCLPIVNEKVIFTVDDIDTPELEKIPAFIQKEIKESLEYKGEIADVPESEINLEDLPF